MFLGYMLGVYMLLDFMLGIYVEDICWGYKCFYVTSIHIRYFHVTGLHVGDTCWGGTHVFMLLGYAVGIYMLLGDMLIWRIYQSPCEEDKLYTLKLYTWTIWWWNWTNFIMSSSTIDDILREFKFSVERIEKIIWLNVIVWFEVWWLLFGWNIHYVKVLR